MFFFFAHLSGLVGSKNTSPTRHTSAGAGLQPALTLFLSRAKQIKSYFFKQQIGFISTIKETKIMKQVVPLRYDVIFKKAFSVPKIFTAFVHDFLNIDLEIDTVEKDKTYEPPIGNVAAKFDLYAEDKKNRIIVDMQHVRFPDHYHRFLHYHCAALLDQIVRSKDYRPHLKVFTGG